MSTGHRFFKLSGAGNDFLVLVEPAAEPAVAEIRGWCRRGLSLGADGLLVLRREGSAARLVHFNPDGGRSALCLNGTRCAARLAFHLGWAAEALRLETDIGAIAARPLGGERIAVELPPMVQGLEAIELRCGGESFSCWRVQVGVPHLVVPWAGDLRSLPLPELGPRLRAHRDLGPDGANVDFVHFGGRRRFEIRSFERGVEAETLACGTGVVAAAAAGASSSRLELPAVARTAGGFELEVASGGRGDQPGAWTLSGDARLIAEGELYPGAAALPATDPP